MPGAATASCQLLLWQLELHTLPIKVSQPDIPRRIHHSVLAWLASLAFALLAACGGASTTFPSGGGDGGFQGSTSSGGASGRGGSGSGADAAIGTGPSDDANMTSIDSPTDVLHSTEGDASGDGTGPLPTDGGPAPVLCTDGTSTTQCQRPQVCCVVTTSLPFGFPSATCQSASSTCSGTFVHCSSKADCGDGVCTETGNGITISYSEIACAASCTGSTHSQFCDPNVAGGCPQGMTCQSSTLSGYFACK
ncbi:MAG: hypothetical protein ACLP1X_14830 [Polyangiaceae bacterium]